MVAESVESLQRAMSSFESSYVQSMAFSVVLVTLALSLKHAASQREKDLPDSLVDILSACISLIAFLFGCCAVFIYFSRSRTGIHAISAEARAHFFFSLLGVLLLLAECAVVVTMFLRRVPRSFSS
jgi:p-aminobenzoyl-glutamate transporter AbgT